MGLSQNRITVVTVCDNHYIILLAALIKSIEVTHKTDEKIDLYIINDQINTKNKDKLIRSIDSEMIQIHWLDMSEVIPENIKLPIDRSSFPLNIYARLFIPYFLPEDVEKAVYFDVDIILLKDISDLAKTDMGDKTIAGVVDKSGTISTAWAGIGNYKELGLPPDTKYFNSGVLVINPIKWRNSDITTKIINCINENVNFTNFPDQYGLNVVFANQWLELDPNWNCQSAFFHENPCLIHFTGKKPIYRSYDMNYKDEFYNYLKLTKWNDFKPVGEYQWVLKKIYNKLEKKVHYIKSIF
jgi:lipopolysaccharide biosynthesis glycosyltransferase